MQSLILQVRNNQLETYRSISCLDCFCKTWKSPQGMVDSGDSKRYNGFGTYPIEVLKFPAAGRSGFQSLRSELPQRNYFGHLEDGGLWKLPAKPVEHAVPALHFTLSLNEELHKNRPPSEQVSNIEVEKRFSFSSQHPELNHEQR